VGQPKPSAAVVVDGTVVVDSTVELRDFKHDAANVVKSLMDSDGR